MSAAKAFGQNMAFTTPTRPSPLRMEITKSRKKLDVEEEGKRTPTQASFSGLSGGSVEAPDTPTPVGRRKTSSTLAVGGVIRKSASAMELRPRDEDDVFGPSFPAAASYIPAPSGVPGLIKVTPTGRSQDVINRINRTFAEQRRNRGYDGYQPREDRGLEPTIHNAQGIFPPDANVFVANLSTQLTEDQLEVACHEVFDLYGTNYIQIKRDKNKHPFALVQFETVEAANEAIHMAQGSPIDGRPVRLERTKAERAVIISKTSEGVLTKEEARDILGRYGALECVIPTSIIRVRSGNLPHGMYVRFAFYLDCRDALRGFYHKSSDYKIQLATAVEPLVLRNTHRPNASSVRKNPRSSTDCKSVYVGNLPEGMTREDLGQLFQQFGPVVDVNVVQKMYPGNSVNVFGFVEYIDASHAIAAASIEHWYGDRKLRVEPKEYSARRASRLNTLPSTPPTFGSPRRISPGASAALAVRLTQNELENNFLDNTMLPPVTTAPPSFGTPGFTPPTPGYPYELWEPPQHYIPAHLFSPSPSAPCYPAEPYYGSY